MNANFYYDLNQENSWYCFWDVVILAAVWYLFRREFMRPINISYNRLDYLIRDTDHLGYAYANADVQSFVCDTQIAHLPDTNEMIKRINKIIQTTDNETKRRRKKKQKR